MFVSKTKRIFKYCNIIGTLVFPYVCGYACGNMHVWVCVCACAYIMCCDTSNVVVECWSASMLNGTQLLSLCVVTLLQLCNGVLAIPGKHVPRSHHVACAGFFFELIVLSPAVFLRCALLGKHECVMCGHCMVLCMDAWGHTHTHTHTHTHMHHTGAHEHYAIV